MRRWPYADGLNTGQVKDRSQDTWLPGLKQLRRNHACLRNKRMKLSNSCTLWNQRGRGVSLRLWLALLQPVAAGWGGAFPHLFSPLVAEPGAESAPTFFSLISSHHLFLPALCGDRGQPWSDCRCKNLGPSRLRPEPKKPAQGKTGAGNGKRQIFLYALLPLLKSSLK